jgi:hypothetical protein
MASWRGRVRSGCATASALAILALGAPAQQRYFVIQVVDDQTGRGVPLVELKTTNEAAWWTDSNGIVAFDEPGLMNREVFFHIASSGYEAPDAGFGNRGKALQTTPGARAVIRIKRLNIAERLYRVTGQGIYRDSVLAGERVPLREPVLDSAVMGQDTVMVAPYRGKLYWFWGDTDKPAYPLGNFGATGAVSELPGKGALDPGVGVDLTYFSDGRGFVKPMCAVPGDGMKWLFGLMVIPDEHGVKRLLVRYRRMKDLEREYETGLAMFSDTRQQFERLVRFRSGQLAPDGRPFRAGEYYYFVSPYPAPCVRVKAEWRAVQDPGGYEAFNGHAWERGTKPIAEKYWRDFETGAAIDASAGSVYWNAYRRRWIAILQKNMGEVWYAEADTPTGPWVYARRVVRHDHYTYYWPGQHPWFDQEGGRVIYFEGTYTDSFSDAKRKTPRYNYNQLMYRLRLDDPRLFLPAPIYKVDGVYQMREGVEAAHAWARVEAVPFFAFAPDRRPPGLELVGIYSSGGKPASRGEGAPVFYVLAPRAATRSDTMPLADESGRIMGLVWRNPCRELMVDR